MAYTTLQRVQRRAGVALTSAQVEEAALLLPAADRFIDQRTGTSWPSASIVTGEWQRLYSQEVRLRQPPVQAVTAVRVRRNAAGATATTLGATEYELRDARLGLLLVPGFWSTGWERPGQLVEVDYTRPAAADGLAVDPRVALVATDLVVYWLGPTLGAGASSAGLPAGAIKSYSVGGDLQVTFEDGGRWGTGRTLGVPADLVALLDGLRAGRVAFA